MEFSVEALRPIPSVALIPIAMLTFGFGFRMEIAIVSFASFWPVLILTRNAVASVDPALMDVARVLRLQPVARTMKIVLPAALPRIFMAFRLAAGIALTVAVTVEVSTNPMGLGYGMILAEQSLHPDLMLAYLVWVGVLGWGLNFAITSAQRRLFRRSAHASAGAAGQHRRRERLRCALATGSEFAPDLAGLSAESRTYVERVGAGVHHRRLTR